MTEKIYLENPYIRELKARIVEKEYINNKFYIKLNRTIFYPNMAGGQPRDKGTINGIEVKDVYEDGNDIVHVIDENIQSDKVHLCIDWKTRFDYMQQHSGQHLLSSVFYKLYNAETIGFHLGNKYVYIDINIPKLTQEDVEKVEKFANKVISSNFNIKTYTIEEKEISKLPVRKQPSIKSNIRIVEIDGMDYCPCCGTHHRSTGELGLIKIRKWEKHKNGTRVEFVCGNRALEDYIWKNKSINNIANLLSSKDCDIEEKVKKVFAQKQQLEKENKILKTNLLKYKANKLLTESKKYKNINIVLKKFDNLNFKNITFISSFLKEKDNVITILGIENKNKYQFILSRSNNLNINMKQIFKFIYDNKHIKGGGNTQTIQGGCSKENLDFILNKTYETILKEI